MHTERLEYLRGELRAERISLGEIAELQSLVPHIDPNDTELLEAAGVPEFPEDDVPDRSPWMICPECRGDGKHSKHLGEITEEDRERGWDPDDFERYISGEYDKICDACRGAGKLQDALAQCEKLVQRWAATYNINDMKDDR